MNTSAKHLPAFEELKPLPPRPPRLAGQAAEVTRPGDERRQIGEDLVLDSRKIFRFGVKRYIDSQGGAHYSFMLRALTPDGRVFDETFTNWTASALHNALEAFLEIVRTHACDPQPRPRDHAVTRAMPPTGPQPSALQRKKQEAALRRGDRRDMPVPEAPAIAVEPGDDEPIFPRRDPEVAEAGNGRY